MAIIESGATAGVLATVDNTYKAVRGQNRPCEFGTGGHFQWAKRSGTIAAALAANAVLFSFRWGSATKVAAIREIRLQFQTLTVWTAHQETSFEAYVGRSFTASHTGGTAATLTGNMGKARTTMTTSEIPTNGDLRIASTAALGGGTITIDTDPFAVGLGSPLVVNAAAGTAYSAHNRPDLFWSADPADGEHPIILAQNEGIIIRNAIVWPAAGTAVIAVQIKWMETDAY